VPRIPARARLASILLLAILLRVGFFVGLASGDPQDDGVYYGNAFALYNEGPRYLETFRNLPADFLANPIDQFHVRPMITYPIAASFALFGPGEISASAWALVCSMLSVLVIYRLGCRLHDQTIGLIAALLCAFYPLEVINATRILSDVQVGLFSALALLLLVEGSQRQNAMLHVLSGTAAAAAYLANGRGLMFLGALLACALVLSVARKADWRAPFWILAGFIAIFSVEALVYYRRTGDPLLSYHIQRGASRFKYLHEPVSSSRWGFLEVRYTNGRPLDLVRSVFLLNDHPTNQFGVFFFFFATSALFSLLRRRNLLLVGLALGLFLYLAFGPIRLSVDRAHHTVQYMMVFQQERFLLMLTAPLVVVGAYFLRAVGGRSRIAAAALTVILFATSLAAVAHTRRFYRSGLFELRTMAGQVRANPDRVFFGDLWAVIHLNIFTRHQAHNLRVLDSHTTANDVRGTCVMLGGSRGVELEADYVTSTLPGFARSVVDTGEAPPGWRLVTEIPGERSAQRQRDFRVYCVP